MMGLADYNLTPKAKKGIKDARKFAEANNHSIINNSLCSVTKVST